MTDWRAELIRTMGWRVARASVKHGFLYLLRQLLEQIAGVWDESYSKS
jgi:hypothetical protein